MITACRFTAGRAGGRQLGDGDHQFVRCRTAEEHAELTARTRSGRTEHRDWVRAQIVLAAAVGASNAAIAAQLAVIWA
jgi:hypothetical protein